MLKLPELDDRSWDDLVEEARALIPTIHPTWTDHNPSDPGIVLLELFAWLSEMVIYRINEVPDENYWTFLKIIRGSDVDRSLGLETAILETVRDLRTQHRAITPADYERHALEQWPVSQDAEPLGWRREVARARCIPERNLAADPEVNAPGHVSLVVMPRRPVLEFDGEDYLTCAVDPYQRLTGDLTVSAWICPSNVAKGFQPILARGGEFSLVLHDTGHVSLGHGADPLGPILGSMRIDNARWSHVAITRNAATKTVTFYLDGKPLGAEPYTEEPSSDTGSISVAGTPESLCNFGGLLIDACVWRRVRTPDEIAAEPSSPSRPGASQLVACLSDRFSPGWSNADGVLLGDPALFGPVWKNIAHDDLLEGLKHYLNLRRLVTTRVHTVSPTYVEITIEAALYLRMDGDAAAVRARADRAVRSLFDPVIGWHERRGWPFGRSLYLSDLYTALEGVEGVDYVKAGRLGAGDPARELFHVDADGTTATAPFGIALRDHELPIIGSVKFTLMESRRGQWQEVVL